MNVFWDLLNQFGLSQNEVVLIRELYILLLLIPIVSTIVALFRYIIGTKSLSIYTPIILTFVFFELGMTNAGQDVMRGLKFGIFLFTAVFILSSIGYLFIKKARMHYIPKLSFVLIFVSIGLIGLLILTSLLGLKGLLYIDQFTLVIVAILTEPIVSVIARKSFRYAFFSTTNTLFIAMICYLLISIQSLQSFVENNPWIVLVLIVLNIYIGRFTGLRITEYWRFRDILFKKTSETDDKPRENSTK